MKKVYLFWKLCLLRPIHLRKKGYFYVCPFLDAKTSPSFSSEWREKDAQNDSNRKRVATSGQIMRKAHRVSFSFVRCSSIPNVCCCIAAEYPVCQHCPQFFFVWMEDWSLALPKTTRGSERHLPETHAMKRLFTNIGKRISMMNAFTPFSYYHHAPMLTSILDHVKNALLSVVQVDIMAGPDTFASPIEITKSIFVA